MRQVYRLLGLVRRYGPGPVDTACTRALDLDVVNVTKIASMLEKATENTPPPPRPPAAATARFARDPAEYRRHPADPHPRREGGHPMTTTIRDPVSPDLRKTLRALKLGQMLDTLPERLTLARQQKMAHAEFLELVLADEVTRRDAKSASLRARAAGLDPTMRLDTWDEPATVSYDRQLWNELTSLRFIDGPHGILILGPVGVGKTHLASALGHIAIRRRLTVHFARAGQAVQPAQGGPPRQHPRRRDAPPRRASSCSSSTTSRSSHSTPPRPPTSTSSCVERHQQASTIVTSNRTAEEWLTMMTDPLLAQSAVDRLISAAHELIIEGESYRQRRNHPSTTRGSR